KSGGSSGVGFAVPSNTITRVVNQLIKFGKVKQPGFGVEGFPDSVNRQLGLKGFIIRSVSPGSEAEKANLQGTKVDRYRNIILGDIIVEVSGKKINNYDDLYNELEDRKIGSSVEIKILRSNKYINVKVKLMDISQVE
ncbi:MAG: peptidase, partial [Zetaproteobacteria bacterium]|nr:peptidase [Pseudobdellovibrionaceae bacterium]